MTQSELDPWNTPLEDQYADGRLRARVLQAKVDQLLHNPNEYNARVRARLMARHDAEVANTYREVQQEVAAQYHQRIQAQRAARRGKVLAALNQIRVWLGLSK